MTSPERRDTSTDALSVLVSRWLARPAGRVEAPTHRFADDAAEAQLGARTTGEMLGKR